MFMTAGTDLKFHGLFDGSTVYSYQPLETGNIDSLSWSKDNAFITFVVQNSKPEIISVRDPNKLKNIHLISSINGVSAIAFQRLTKRIIGIGTDSGQIALYDTKNKNVNKYLESAQSRINLLDFNVNDKVMAVSCNNGAVLVYDIKQSDISNSYPILKNSCPTAMRFHSNEKNLLGIGTEDGTLVYYDVEVGKNVFLAQNHSAPITGLTVVKNVHSFASVGYDRKFCIQDLYTGNFVFRSNLQYPLSAVDASSDGLTVAIGSIFGHLYVYDIRNLVFPVVTEKPHKGRINKILFQCETLGKVDQDSQTAECYLNEYEKTKADAINFSKDNVANSIQKNGEYFQDHLIQQMNNLYEFIANEFHLIENEIDSKWDVSNFSNMVFDDEKK